MSVCFIKYVSQRKQRGRDNLCQDFLNTEYQHGQMTEWRGEMCSVSQHQSYTGTSHGAKLRRNVRNQLGVHLRQIAAHCIHHVNIF